MTAATAPAWRPLWPELEGLVRQRQPGGKLPRSNGEGWIGAIRSPLRDDGHPSFSVRPDSEVDPGAFVDHANGDSGSMADLARRLGLEVGGRPRPAAAPAPVPATLEAFARQRHLDPERLRSLWRVAEVRHAGRPALRFPTRLEVDRVKFLDGGKPKATWAGAGGRSHCYGLGEARRIGGEVLYIVNGEPGTWAATQAGAPAVCFCIGEDTAPGADVLAELAGSGFRRFAVVYDRDDAGRRGARRVLEALRGAELEAVALELPADLGEHGDVDDLHRRVGDRLGEVLAGLPELGLTGISSSDEPAPGVLLSEVTPEAVRWLWPGRVPLGKLTVIDGDPGLGKSTITLDLAARVSRGGAMPDGAPGVLGGVGLLTAEDGLSDTVRPRLEAHGAALARIVALPFIGEGDERRPVTLPADLGVLRAAIRRVGALLVVIDPLMAFLDGKVDSHRDQDVRRVLAQLAALAEETGAAVVIVRHLNKTAVGNPLYRGGGSIGIIGAARAGFIVAKHPEHDEMRVLAPTKANLSRPAPSLAFVLDTVGEVPRVRWLGESEQSAETLLAVKDETAARPRDEAAAFLREVLADGPLPARDVYRQAEDAGISARTLKRAKSLLGVAAVKAGAPGAGGQGWSWELPKGATSDEECQQKTVAPFGKSGPLRGEETEPAEVEL